MDEIDSVIASGADEDRAAAARKGKKGRRRLIVALLAALFVAGAALSFVLLFMHSDLRTPVKLAQSYANAKSVDAEDYCRAVTDGCEGGSAAKIIRLLKKSSVGGAAVAEWESAQNAAHAALEAQYGARVKVRYQLNENGTEPLALEQLKTLRSEIKELGEDYYALGQALCERKGEELDALAETLGMDAGDAKALFKAVRAVGQKLKGAEIPEGYELELLCRVSGSKQKEAAESNRYLTVLQINGQWVGPDGVEALRELYRTLTQLLGES